MAATQAVLEWPRLCTHIARFASTTLGRQAALTLQVSLCSLQKRIICSDACITILHAPCGQDMISSIA